MAVANRHGSADGSRNKWIIDSQPSDVNTNDKTKKNMFKLSDFVDGNNHNISTCCCVSAFGSLTSSDTSMKKWFQCSYVNITICDDLVETC